MTFMRSHFTPETLVTTSSIAAVLAAGVVLSVISTAAQQPADVSSGQGLYNTYCATCHGTNGTGSGPLAPVLRHAPPDITGLALANGGVFPDARMRRIIDGREVDSHGNREMPVWGDAFRSMRGGHSEASVQARINAILTYLASLQRRQA
ncbi:MAG: cytochrome c [Vicinamibacterales bacterium]